MKRKSVQLYTPENMLEAFYHAIRTNTLRELHIPHSSVFYVRAAIEAGTGVRYTLKHVETAMKAEGMLNEGQTMFEAFVLVCLLSNPTLCHTLADIEGPYKNKEMCTQRAYEIAAKLPSFLPGYVAQQYRCTKQVKGLDV